MGAALLSAAQLFLLLRPSSSLRRPVRRRALAGALGTGQCAAASCRVVGSVVGAVAASQRAEAQVEGGGQGGQLRSSGPAAGHPAAVGQRRLGHRLCVSASRCALEGFGHRQLPLRRSDRSRRHCLRCGRGRPRQCSRGGGGIVVGTGEVDIGQGRGFTRGAVGVVVVALAVSLALLFGRARRGLSLQLADRSRRWRLPSSRGRW